MNISKRLKEDGFIFVGENPRTYSEWMKSDSSVNKMITVRVYDEGNNRVIMYRAKGSDPLSCSDVLFNGKLDSIEIFNLIYSLVKI